MSKQKRDLPEINFIANAAAARATSLESDKNLNRNCFLQPCAHTTRTRGHMKWSRKSFFFQQVGFIFTSGSYKAKH